MGNTSLNGNNSWFTAACGSWGKPMPKGPTTLLMSFTVKENVINNGDFYTEIKQKLRITLIKFNIRKLSFSTQLPNQL
jgi:hypothetical protein